MSEGKGVFICAVCTNFTNKVSMVCPTCMSSLARLTEENERLSDVKRLVQEYPLTAEGMAQLRTRVEAAEGELAELRCTTLKRL